MDVPILIFVGAWVLLLGWDVGGGEGLIVPGILGWLLWLIAALRILLARMRGRPLAPRAVGRRGWVLAWAACAAAFLAIASAELFVSRPMPPSWKEAAAKALHVRTVYRTYGSPP